MKEKKLGWKRMQDEEPTHCCLYQNIGMPCKDGHLFLTCVYAL